MGPDKNNKAFVVSGRDAASFDAICELLRALQVEPVTWRMAAAETNKNNPNFGEILSKGFEVSGAVLVLLTPDEDTVLRTELRKSTDAGDRNKTGPVAQPRPNVLYELGYSMATSRTKTIVVLFHGCRVPSDMYGLHAIEHDAARVEHTVSEIERALEHAGVAITRLPEDEIPQRCRKLLNLPARGSGARDYVRAGTAIRTSEFAFDKVLDEKCDEILMVGTNFGDQFGQRGQAVDGLFRRLKTQLTCRPTARVTLVFAPPALLKAQNEKAFVHLRDFSLPRLSDLYDDPEFEPHHRARLRILSHPGAMYFQTFVRDSHDEERALLVATPRWPADAAGPGRFFFAVWRKEQPAMFDTLYAQIPSDLELGGAVSFERVAQELGVRRRTT